MTEAFSKGGSTTYYMPEYQTYLMESGKTVRIAGVKQCGCCFALSNGRTLAEEDAVYRNTAFVKALLVALWHVERFVWRMRARYRVYLVRI